MLIQYCLEVRNYKNTDFGLTSARGFYSLFIIGSVYTVKLGIPTWCMKTLAGDSSSQGTMYEVIALVQRTD